MTPDGLPRPCRDYEMNLETALTIWLVLISPWNVTMTVPEPFVPGSGGRPGSTGYPASPCPGEARARRESTGRE